MSLLDTFAKWGLNKLDHTVFKKPSDSDRVRELHDLTEKVLHIFEPFWITANQINSLIVEIQGLLRVKQSGQNKYLSSARIKKMMEESDHPKMIQLSNKTQSLIMIRHGMLISWQDKLKILSENMTKMNILVNELKFVFRKCGIDTDHFNTVNMNSEIFANEFNKIDFSYLFDDFSAVEIEDYLGELNDEVEACSLVKQSMDGIHEGLIGLIDDTVTASNQLDQLQ